VQVELKKGETILTDALLHLPAACLRKAFSDRSGVPPEHFELYYRGKRLEGDAALASWGVGKNATIEVKMRGRGGGCVGAKEASSVKEAATAAAADEAVAESLGIEPYGGSMSAGGSNGSGGSDGGGGVGGVRGVKGVGGGSEALGKATTAPLRTAVEVTLHGDFDLTSTQASIAHRPTRPAHISFSNSSALTLSQPYSPYL
jgi:hypothetical protein